jgi:hypothetical protein
LAASVVGGAATGALLGTAGGLLAPAIRLATASLLGLVAMAIGASELAGKVPLLQCDRETPQPWMQHGALRWALRNGLTLGCGATTWLGFWLWYVIPASALLSGDARVGALLYAGYGTARGSAALLLLALMRFGQRPLGRDDVAIWVLEQRTLAQRLAAACLLTVGAAVAVTLGV